MSVDGVRSSSSGATAAAVVCLPDDWELRQQLSEAADRIETRWPDCTAVDRCHQLVVAIRTVLNNPRATYEQFWASLTGSIYMVSKSDRKPVDSWNQVYLAVMGWDPFEPEAIVFNVEMP